MPSNTYETVRPIEQMPPMWLMASVGECACQQRCRQGELDAGLTSTSVFAGDRRLHHLLLVARSSRALVALDQSDQTRAVARHIGANHEADGLARRDAEVVGVTEQRRNRGRRGHPT
jgi:hypothetical protein